MMHADPPAGRCPKVSDNQEENREASLQEAASSAAGYHSACCQYAYLTEPALLKLISGIGNKEIPVEGLLAWADL